MSNKGEAWDAFWDVAASVLVAQARRAPMMAHLRDLDCAEVDRLVRSCDRAMRDLRAAIRALPGVLGPDIAAPEVQRMQDAVKQATLANRSLKAAWRAVRPSSLEG